MNPARKQREGKVLFEQATTKKERQQKFSDRKKGLMKKVGEIEKICNAKVFLKLQSESGTTYVYASDLFYEEYVTGGLQQNSREQRIHVEGDVYAVQKTFRKDKKPMNIQFTNTHTESCDAASNRQVVGDAESGSIVHNGASMSQVAGDAESGSIVHNGASMSQVVGDAESGSIVHNAASTSQVTGDAKSGSVVHFSAQSSNQVAVMQSSPVALSSVMSIPVTKSVGIPSPVALSYLVTSPVAKSLVMPSPVTLSYLVPSAVTQSRSEDNSRGTGATKSQSSTTGLSSPAQKRSKTEDDPKPPKNIKSSEKLVLLKIIKKAIKPYPSAKCTTGSM